MTPAGAETGPRSLRRRVNGRDVVIHRGDGFRGLDLDEGFRVHLVRRGGGWDAYRWRAAARIARAETLTEIVGIVVRHYAALQRTGRLPR